ncbi:MAG: hypothetical protein EA391_11190 [Balneolaceae bacterium]|nr:MAG: hypothetical protein EA391_11190 [Balneolaceae bacterium]
MSEKEHIEILKSIEKFILGELSQSQIDDLWVEFLKNPEYYKLFETELYMRGLAGKGIKPNFSDDLSQVKEPAVSYIYKYRVWFAAAAAALLITIGLQFFSINEQQAMQQWALSSIDTNEMLGAEIFRSDEPDVASIDIAINEALALAFNDETIIAIERFRELLTMPHTESQRVRIEVNLGILLYNVTAYESAVVYFESALGAESIDRNLKEKTYWFLGNAYLNIGQVNEARDAVFEAYTLSGRFQSPALALLKKLDQRIHTVPPDAVR